MENYYDNSSRWVFDRDGNFLHSKRKEYNPNIQREDMFFSDTKTEEEEYLEYLFRKEKQL